MPSLSRVLLAAVAALALPLAAQAAGTPEQQCQVAKNKAAGKHADCRHKAEAGLATTGDTTKYGAAIQKCSTKLATAWAKARNKAILAGTTCFDEAIPRSAYEAVIDAHTENVATALEGGVLTDCASELDACTSDLETANSGTALEADVLAGKTFASSSGLALTGAMPDNGAVSITPGTSTQAIATGYHNGGGTVEGDAELVSGNIKNGVTLFGVTGSLQPPPLRTGQTTSYGPGSDGDLQKGATRSYTDNGDGTITDDTTGLMWEKKSDDGSIHDKDNTYSWGMVSSPYTMNGTMVTIFLAALNTGGGFAGHSDWRVPNINELQSLANYQNVTPAVSAAFNGSCAASCSVTTCSCTQSDAYWSSSYYQDGPTGAWGVHFYNGDVRVMGKSNGFYVRAVRGGS